MALLMFIARVSLLHPAYINGDIAKIPANVIQTLPGIPKNNAIPAQEYSWMKSYR